MSEMQVTFRPIAETDLPTMSRWLQDPDVSPWYGEGSTEVSHLASVYADVIARTDSTSGFIIVVDGIDAGYIQGYLIDPDDGYGKQIDVPAGAGASDLFIGNADFRGRGLGAQVVAQFTEEFLFGTLDAAWAMIGPSPDNARAIRSYEQAGCRWFKTVYVVDEGAPHNTCNEYLMRKDRF